MGFTKDTVNHVMCLIDEHKEEMQESQYIQVCNLMKHIHEQQSHSPLDEWILHDSTIQDIRSSIEDKIRLKVRLIENQISAYSSLAFTLKLSLETTTLDLYLVRQGRIKNEDKFDVCKKLFGYDGLKTTKELTKFIKQLQIDGYVKNSKEFCQICHKERVNNYSKYMITLEQQFLDTVNFVIKLERQLEYITRKYREYI